jgi:addiction module HigA family antidote
MNKKLHSVHPGEVLHEEFLKPLSISQNKIARDIKVPPRRINEIVLGKRRVTADTALRLAIYFKTSPQFWMNLQSSYDLDIELDELGNKITKEVHAFSLN